MGDKSAIEWTDSTWNPVRGCTRVSPGCGGPKHEGGCYAETLAARFSDPGQPYHGFAERTPHGGRWTGKVALLEAMLTVPLKWKRGRRIFVNSMSDLFHESLPDEAIDRVFAVMALAPQHTFQVLTKRALRMREYVAARVSGYGDQGPSARFDERLAQLTVATGRSLSDFATRWPLPNVWLGVSVERQEEAAARVPALIDTPAAVRFLSCEPLLGPLEIGPYLRAFNRDDMGLRDDPLAAALLGTGIESGHAWARPALGWAICGGESGPGARPMHPAWARHLRDQCVAAGVPFFFKQWGAWIDADNWLHRLRSAPWSITAAGAPWEPRRPLNYEDAAVVAGLTGARYQHQSDGATVIRVGKRRAGRLLDGREWNEFPKNSSSEAGPSPSEALAKEG